MCRTNKPSKYETPFRYFLKCPIVPIGFKVIYENATKPHWLTKVWKYAAAQMINNFFATTKRGRGILWQHFAKGKTNRAKQNWNSTSSFFVARMYKRLWWGQNRLSISGSCLYPTSLSRAAPLRRFLSVGLKSGLVAPPPTLQRPRFLGHRRLGGKEGRARQRQGRAASHLANYYRLTIPVKDLTPMVQ